MNDVLRHILRQDSLNFTIVSSRRILKAKHIQSTKSSVLIVTAKNSQLPNYHPKAPVIQYPPEKRILVLLLR